MTKEEYLALASSKWDSLEQLKAHDDFYDYEKSFSELWLDLGRVVLQTHLGKVSLDRRKKKKSKRASAK